MATHDLVLEGFKQTLEDGEPVQLPGGARFVSAQRLVFEDEVGEVVEARPLTLRRKYIALESSGDLAPPEVEGVIKATASSPLVGASILYTWVPEEQGYGRFYDAREESESLLPGTAADPFLAALAPPLEGGAAPASWVVPAQRLMGLLAPGGDLGFSPGEEREGRRMARTMVNGVGGGLENAFAGEADGSLTITRSGLGSDDEGRAWLVYNLTCAGPPTDTVTQRMTGM